MNSFVSRKLLFRRRHSLPSSDSIVPFSWSVALICVLHLFVWSVGVLESGARDFYLRDQNTFKEVNIRKISIWDQSEEVFYAAEQQKELAEKAQREKNQKEAATAVQHQKVQAEQTKKTADTKQHRHAITAQIIAALITSAAANHSADSSANGSAIISC